MKRILILMALSLLAKFGFSQSAQIPQFNSSQEKETWIKAHPKEYQQLLDQSVANAKSITGSVQSVPAGTTATDPTFPQYMNTGNKQKDDAGYKSAKEAWIKEHPAKYAEMTNKTK